MNECYRTSTSRVIRQRRGHHSRTHARFGSSSVDVYFRCRTSQDDLPPFAVKQQPRGGDCWVTWKNLLPLCQWYDAGEGNTNGFHDNGVLRGVMSVPRGDLPNRHTRMATSREHPQKRKTGQFVCYFHGKDRTWLGGWLTGVFLVVNNTSVLLCMHCLTYYRHRKKVERRNGIGGGMERLNHESRTGRKGYTYIALLFFFFYQGDASTP